MYTIYTSCPNTSLCVFSVAHATYILRWERLEYVQSNLNPLNTNANVISSIHCPTAVLITEIFEISWVCCLYLQNYNINYSSIS